ncbi:hypothetical protein ACXET9_04920 [Brachybacterium sp. DNPG3]
MGVQLQVRASGDEERAEKLARARAALGAAEHRAARWGGRIDRTALRSIGGVHPASRPPSAAPSALSPAASAAAAALSPATAPDIAPPDAGTHLPAPGPLAPLFPRGGLRAGSSVAVAGAASTSLLLSLAVSATGEDGWCAVAGMPDLGLRSAIDAGLDPHRLAVAPVLGEQVPKVLTALVDGVGVLVLGPGLELAPALWRSLLGRARTADTLVLAAAPPGRADIALSSASLDWQGLGAGSGRIRRRRLEVVSRGRGIAGENSVEVLLPQAMGMIEAIAPATPTAAATAAAEATAPVAAHPALRMVSRAAG